MGLRTWNGVLGRGAVLRGGAARHRLGVRHSGRVRLEARSATGNGRGNGALRKMGAVQEAVLRQSLWQDDEYLDQVLWTLTPTTGTRCARYPGVKVH